MGVVLAYLFQAKTVMVLDRVVSKSVTTLL